MTLALNQSRNPIIPALLCALIVMLSVMYGSHALLQHGVQAENIRKCLENQPPVMQLLNPITGRVAKICPLNEHFGVQIVEGNREVTSFPNKNHLLDGVIKYLRNKGYTISVP